jgi:hypothetical protein
MSGGMHEDGREEAGGMILLRHTAASRSGSNGSLLRRDLKSYSEERSSKEKTMSWAAWS